MRISSAVRSFVLIFIGLSISQPLNIFGCSSDYLIWQIRNKNADPYYRFVRNGKAGYIDGKGKVIIQPTLFLGSNGGQEFHNGLLLTGVADGSYIDASGKTALDTGLDRNWDFSEGLAAGMRDGENRWGYIDRTGNFVIEPKFESYPNGYVYSFSSGVAMIEVKDRFGFINRSGEYVIKPTFLYAQSFQDGFARVIADGPCVRGADLETPCDFGETIGNTIEGAKVPPCKFRFIDKSGTPISNAEFENSKDFSEGVAAVQVAGKWGFIDRTGAIIIQPRFSRVSSFSDGLARVALGDTWKSLKWGYVNKSGKVIIPIQFEIADDFSDGVAPVGSRNPENNEFYNYYFINKTGKRAFSGTFEQASHFFKGVAHVKLIERPKKEDAHYLEGKYAYIDTRGRTIFSYERRSEDE